jgi:zinc D-Ala-D-Ala carboxypeptidase
MAAWHGGCSVRTTMRRLVFMFPVALAMAACEPADARYDLGLEPDELDGKSDEVPCAGFTGGELAGDDLLVLINKELDQTLRSDWEPTDLEPVPARRMKPNHRGMLRAAARAALEELLQSATDEAGLTLGVLSAHRSYETQCLTFRARVDEMGLEEARRFSAEPGHSQHQLGTTADILSPRLDWQLSAAFGDEPEGRWLANNAHRFGFALSYPRDMEEITGYGYEPWHIRFIGAAAAAELRASGMILEQYLRACQDDVSNLSCPRG